MRYKWRNNVDYISFQKLRTDAYFSTNDTLCRKGTPRSTASVSTHDRLTQNTVSLPTRAGNLKTEVYQMEARHKKIRRRTERGLHPRRT